MKITTILDHIDGGSMALPEFQRGYVWNREQVRGLMTSLYRKYPVGSLLVWVTPATGAKHRGESPTAPGVVKLLLDGQQRITSLYGIIRGAPPSFFDGNRAAFTGLYFHLDEQTFEFFAPAKMKDNPLWIDVTGLMRHGVAESIQRVVTNPALSPRMTVYIERLSNMDAIRNIDLHVEEVVGADKGIDVVVDIFNRVNTGGTKLSKGDLALAKLCAEWPEARDELKARLGKYRRAGYYFRMEWLLRAVNAVLTGSAFFDKLAERGPDEVAGALLRTEKRIDYLLNLIAGRLGLDHDRVLGSRYSFPLLARFLDANDGRLSDPRERDRLLFWYVHSFLWGRYSGSTETVLAQDLALIEGGPGALDRLVAQLRQSRGDLSVHAADFHGSSRGARFYPLLYMLTRTWEARDFDTGNPLKSHLLGHMSQLEVHHVFPKSLLRKHGYKPGERNALANFTFLTKDTNLLVGDRAPAEYLADYASKHPGVVESHWIPMDPALWQLENYPEFLARRRELLAAAANQFLDSLQGGTIPQTVQMEAVLAAPLENVRRHPSQEAEEAMLDECSDWIATHGLPPGERNFELIDRETQEVIATVDLAWPSGLQEGLSKPVALLLGESSDTRDAVSEADFRCFTDMESFRTYVEHDVLVGDDEDADGDAGGGTLRTLEDWRARTSPITVGLAERLLSSINEHVSPRFGRTYQLNPRVHFIGLSDGDRSRNFVMFKPRKGFLRILATVPGVDGWVDRLEAAGLPANARGMRARVNVTPDDFRRCEATLVELVVQAADEHHV